MTSSASSILGRFQDADNLMKLGAVAGGVFQLFVPDAFFWLFLILVGSNLADWLFGRHAARAKREFDRTKSREGLLGKAAQLTVLLLLRSLEAVIPLTGLPSTLGLGSAALCLALVVEDLESLERHVVVLSGSGIPGLSPVLERLRVVTGGDRRNPNGPIPPSDHPRRRHDDPPPGDPPHPLPDGPL